MRRAYSLTLIACCVSVVLGAMTFTQAEEKVAKKGKGKSAQIVRLYIEGAFCEGCSAVLTGAVKGGGVLNATKISPNAAVKYVIVSGELSHKANLSVLARAVNDAKTPHRDVAKPGIALELFAKLDKAASKATLASLAKIEGVDAKGSSLDVKRGVIAIRLNGEGKVSVDSLVAVLGKDGIKARVVTSSVRRILGKKEEKKEEKKDKK